MGNLTSALQQLRAERKQAQSHVEKVGSSDCSDRVIKRVGNIPQSEPTDPNNIAGFTAQDGTGATSEMGKRSQRITASGDRENNGLDFCETHHVSSSPQEDRSVPTSEMGQAESSAEEGCIVRPLGIRTNP
jgi:hypothetical protein